MLYYFHFGSPLTPPTPLNQTLSNRNFFENIIIFLHYFLRVQTLLDS